jgi:hypothetical protein
MIRPPATTTTDPGTRRPIETSVRPELDNEATPRQERNRPLDGTNPISARDGTNPNSRDLGSHPDGTNPISAHDGTNPISHELGTAPARTNPISRDLAALPDGTKPISRDMGTILDGTNPISPHDDPDRSTKRTQFRGPPARKEPPGARRRVRSRGSRTTARISPKRPGSPIVAYQRPIVGKRLCRSGQFKPPSPWRWPWPFPWSRRRTGRCGRPSCRR